MKQIPVSFNTVSFCSAVSATSTPSFSRTSAAPLRLDTLRFPCFATGTPPAATTNADVVEMLKVPTWSPPVPTISMTSLSGLIFTPFSRITSANAVISSMVSPCMESAIKRPPICACVAVPSIISSMTPLASSYVRSSFFVNFAIASLIIIFVLHLICLVVSAIL